MTYVADNTTQANKAYIAQQHTFKHATHAYMQTCTPALHVTGKPAHNDNTPKHNQEGPFSNTRLQRPHHITQHTTHPA